MKLFTICLMILLFSGCSNFAEYNQNRLAIEKIRRDFVQEHSTSIMKELIAENKIAIGMNVIEVLISIGEPFKKYTSTYSWGVHDQWEYLTGNSYRRLYLYFENDFLTSWHN